MARVRLPHPHVPRLTLTQVRVLRLLLLLAVFSWLVLYAVFRSSRFQELMRKKSEKLLSETLKRKVTIGGFDLDLVPPAFVVRDIWISNDPQGTPGPCFAAEEVSLRGIPQVSDERISLPKVRVIAPRVLLEIYPGGRTNFSSILEALPRSPGTGRDLRVREAVLQRGTIRFREWKARLDAIVEGTALVARSGLLSRVTRASLACRRAQLKIADGEVLDMELGADVLLAPGRVHLDAIRVRSELLSVDASGGVEEGSGGTLGLTARLRFDALALGRYFDVGVPLTGPVSASASLRFPPGGGYRIRALYDMPAVKLGPFPMSASGTLRVDPEGLLLRIAKGEYAGGSMEGLVRVTRLRSPPIPIRIAVTGKGLELERFLGDLGLAGTGLMARADLSSTLTFGEGGIEKAEGVGTLLLRPDPGRPSMVKGRFALPSSGGGPLLIRKGVIGFDRMPITTAGGVQVTLDGGLKIGPWTPDFDVEVTASDLAEAERVASNFYPAIKGQPLAPPLKLGGSGTLKGRFERSFSDPRVTGAFTADRFVLRAVPFGRVEAQLTVDHDVLTMAPFAAIDGGARLTLEGTVGWGRELGEHYSLGDLAMTAAGWPVERILRFLDLDLPVEGPVTGRLPVSGITPTVLGSGALAFGPGKIWGQQLDHLEGTFALEKERLRIASAHGRIGTGALQGDFAYRYGAGGLDADVTAAHLPLARLDLVASAAPALGGELSGRLQSRGTVDVQDLAVSGSIAGLVWDSHPLAPGAAPSTLSATLRGEAFELDARAGDAARLALRGRGRALHVDLGVEKLATYAPLLGLEGEEVVDGRLAGSADCTLTEKLDGLESLKGRLQEGTVSVRGHRLSLAKPATFSVAGRRFALDEARLVSPQGARERVDVRLSGTADLDPPRRLALQAAGTFDAALADVLAEGARLAGPVAVELDVTGPAGKPSLSGRLALDGVDVVTPGGTKVETVTGTLTFSPGRVTTSGLTMNVGGSVDVAGSVALDGLTPSSIRLTAHLSDVRVEPFSGFRGLLSGDLVLLGDSTLRSARGELTLSRGVYDQNVDIGLATLLSSLRAPSPSASEPSSLDAVSLDVRLAIPPGGITVRNNVARARLSGELTARGTVGRPVLLGHAEAEEGGRLELRGLRYDLITAKVLLSNPLRTDPFFELEARTTLRDYQLGIALTGTATRLSPRFYSTPSLTQGQIVNALATGDISQATQPGTPSPITSEDGLAKAARELIAGLATDAAASRTRQLLKLDRLQIDPVFVGSSFDAPRLTLAKSLAPGLTVTYSYKASTNQEQVIAVEYQVRPNAYLQFIRDENGVYSVDLRIRQRLR